LIERGDRIATQNCRKTPHGFRKTFGHTNRFERPQVGLGCSQQELVWYGIHRHALKNLLQLKCGKLILCAEGAYFSGVDSKINEITSLVVSDHVAGLRVSAELAQAERLNDPKTGVRSVTLHMEVMGNGSRDRIPEDSEPFQFLSDKRL
jgi:hypothetical protein